MQLIQILPLNDGIAVRAPYSKDFINTTKQLNAHWDEQENVWVFPHENDNQLASALESLYGQNPNDLSAIDAVLNSQLVVVDVETTGINASDTLTEIGAVKLDGGKITDSFATLVNPERAIPEKVVELTGITQDMVRDAPTIQEAIPQFLEFADLDRSTLVAHNAPFDVGFLKRATDTIGANWPNPKVLDTLQLARTLLPKPQVPSHRLTSMAEHYGVKPNTAHRALADALTCSGVMTGLLNQMKTERILVPDMVINSSDLLEQAQRSNHR